jgi:hypothetical protein
MDYASMVERRRALRIAPYKTLAEVDFDGDWITPLQITSRAMDGPVLIALHWLEEDAIRKNSQVLKKLGYLPAIPFNKVLDHALTMAGLSRQQIYLTQAFHLVPRKRSEDVPKSLIDLSFDEVTKHELGQRRVIALGGDAAGACKRHGIDHVATCHPSRRGWSFEQRARDIASALH